MSPRIRIVALLAALTATLAVASPAMAKGGGGGGGDAKCAKISSYAVTPGAYDDTRASLTVDYAITYSCFDESWPPVSFNIKDESTGQSSTAVFFGPVLPGLQTKVFGAAYATKYTVTLSVTQASNGAVQDTQKLTVTTPAAPQL
jgi:hypothetical protein